MRRTKAWWAALDKDERIELVNIEFTDIEYNDQPFRTLCPFCETFGPPQAGVCDLCIDRRDSIIDKADAAMRED